MNMQINMYVHANVFNENASNFPFHCIPTGANSISYGGAAFLLPALKHAHTLNQGGRVAGKLAPGYCTHTQHAVCFLQPQKFALGAFCSSSMKPLSNDEVREAV
jgi:hypothetical protein